MENRLHESILPFFCVRHSVVMAIDVIPVIMYNFESLNKRNKKRRLQATTTSFHSHPSWVSQRNIIFNIYININKKQRQSQGLSDENEWMNDI
jgi:hypothetical protein